MPFNRLQVCPSLAPFVFTVFIIPSLNVLSDIQLLISQVILEIRALYLVHVYVTCSYNHLVRGYHRTY